MMGTRRPFRSAEASGRVSPNLRGWLPDIVGWVRSMRNLESQR